MNLGFLRLSRISALLLMLLWVLGSSVAYADDSDEFRTYRVTIQNLTSGQPLSPPVAATHRGGIRMFRVGQLASPQLEAIAEDGNEVPMFNLFNASDRVTQAVDIGRPLTPSGKVVGDFTDSATFDIQARPGDRLSLATMLICTNDGITGLDRVRLPKRDTAVFLTAGYDAGTEDNTEQSEDIVDPCSALGPLPLAGDPNGNEDAAVDTQPHRRIRHHQNIEGIGDLSVADHGWTDPVARVTITRVDDNAQAFLARLNGASENPLVDSDATGRARLRLNDNATELRFELGVDDIEGVTQAHIHKGLPNENGPVVAFLFGPVAPTGPIDGRLAHGTVTEADLVGPLAGDFAGFVAALRNGELYVNVHTAAHPGGEIRGQIGAVVDD